MFKNPNVARVVAVVVIALMVITLAASLFGCAQKTTSGTDPDSGLPYVAVTDLPKEARDTLALIDKGGPYPYQRDGVVFQNREQLLPRHNRGYYHEFTVKTPGERDRGARRIVTGQGGEQYYSDDHYKSFRRIKDDGKG